MSMSQVRSSSGWWWLLAFLLITCAVYMPGLHGGFLFDDYPNIVDNHGVQPIDARWGTLVRAALSSPSSEFKRPLASLSFALNYLAAGLDPYWMKLTNLVIHLFNGVLLFLLARALLRATAKETLTSQASLAAWIAGGWMLLPINLTAVLYVVQRMESMANAFVLLGLLGYVAGRQRMLAGRSGGLPLGLASVIACTGLGLLAKETAVMLPLYAFLAEWIVFRFAKPGAGHGTVGKTAKDRRVLGFFLIVLVLPMIAGLTWLLPGLLKPATWATRDFTLGTRLLSEARIVVDYIAWTLLPTPHALSFYHDDFRISTGLLSPWTTLASVTVLVAMAAGVFAWRRRHPLVALGLALYLGCHLLTGTILPLELIYEHRNYFASFGLLLALFPLLSAPRGPVAADPGTTASGAPAGLPLALARHTLLVGLLALWTLQTALTAYAWGNPLRLAEDLAARAPDSPRAQYELGRTYIIYSHYDPNSIFTRMAYAPLERAMNLPESSILPQQALIFMNARMHLPLKDAWWDSMIAKLKARKPTVQDESSLAALTHCAREGSCVLPPEKMTEAYLAALSHPLPSARLLAGYSDYAWNILDDKPLGLSMAEAAVSADPNEPAYQVTLIRMLLAAGQWSRARSAIQALGHLNFGGSMADTIDHLQDQLNNAAHSTTQTGQSD